MTGHCIFIFSSLDVGCAYHPSLAAKESRLCIVSAGHRCPVSPCLQAAAIPLHGYSLRVAHEVACIGTSSIHRLACASRQHWHHSLRLSLLSAPCCAACSEPWASSRRVRCLASVAHTHVIPSGICDCNDDAGICPCCASFLHTFRHCASTQRSMHAPQVAAELQMTASSRKSTPLRLHGQCVLCLTAAAAAAAASSYPD